MQLIRHLPCPLADQRRSALAIGNFDGIHRGHRALIEQAVQQQPELVPSLMCFEPLPRTFFQPDQPIPRLMKLRDRVLVCRQLGIERLFQLRFDRDFAAQSPQQFIDRIVLTGARAGHVIVGQDFRFGNRAAGDVDMLHKYGLEKNFSVTVVDSVLVDEAEKVSSTGLRQALATGDFERVQRLLGRPYSISGRVVRGQQLGRTLGFPTINLRVPEPPALDGIFAVRVNGLNGQTGIQRWPGVASLGKRPTVAGREWLLEVHLIDFDRDLYYQHIQVEFIAKRRSETHFKNLTAMTAEMKSDLQWARRILAPHRTE